VPGHPNIYVIGDASYLDVAGAPLPMMPVAIQMAETRSITSAPHRRTTARGVPLPRSRLTRDHRSERRRPYIRGSVHRVPAWVVWLWSNHPAHRISQQVFVLLNWAWITLLRACRAHHVDGYQGATNASYHAVPARIETPASLQHGQEAVKKRFRSGTISMHQCDTGDPREQQVDHRQYDR